MLRYLLVLSCLCAATYCAVMEQTDTSVSVPLGKVPSVNGQNMYPPQQAIYIYGPNQWRMSNAVNLLEKAGNDYIITPGMGAHKLHVRKLAWNRARRVCIQEGGHLAIINSASEEKILLRVLEENKVVQAWLGVHDLYEEGDWVTVMDEPLEATGYSRWTTKIPNEPDNFNGKQHCGLLLKDGGMDDLECTAANAFFCEISF